MRPWRNSIFFILLLSLLSTGALFAEKKNRSKTDGDKPSKEEKSDKKNKSKNKGKDKEKDADPLQIAVPLDQPVKGLHLPFYDLSGKLKMQFDAVIANRTTDSVVALTTLKIETYDEQGQSEMLVQFPKADYDIATGVITSQDSVEVRRKDFVLTGVGMKFDTKARSGKLFSKIRMEIFNRTLDTPSATPTPNGP